MSQRVDFNKVARAFTKEKQEEAVRFFKKYLNPLRKRKAKPRVP